MKKILLSFSVIIFLSVIIIGGTIAFYSDTEKSTGNVFTAGSVDLKIDHTKQTYNGQDCVGICEEIGDNLVLNGGFEIPNVSSGSWDIFPDASLTSWNIESGPGLEIQDNIAGDPHGGNQFGELDSNNSSVISQSLTTVAGKQYRLTFWYSPRPNIPAGDNTIGTIVKVVSDDTILVNDTIGQTTAGGSSTSWIKYTYNFIAADTNTKLIFSDLGIDNSYGGYLDDISVKEIDCTGQFEGGGACTLWGERDLVQGDTFWNFSDIKPQDFGINVISMHADDNDAYACLIVGDKNDEENPDQPLEPEISAGDVFGIGNPDGKGELSNFINIFTWGDLDGDGDYDVGENSLGSGPLSTITSIMSMDSSNMQFLDPLNTKYIGLAWCAGTLTPNQGNEFICDGSGMDNTAQSDSFTASLTAYAEQVRNNDTFVCSDVNLSND